MTVDQLWSGEDEVTAVGPGENVELKLKGVKEDEIKSGFVLCDPSNVCKTGRIFEAQVLILEHECIISKGSSAVCHIHTVAEKVEVDKVLRVVDNNTKEMSRADYVKKNQTAFIRLEAAGIICMECFEDFPQMSRFTLRIPGVRECVF